MRTPHYVDDTLAMLKWEPLKDVIQVYERMNALAASL
jgi:hypothetical protein